MGVQETEIRPWGKYTVLEDTATHKVKRIEVSPGGKLSYQYHHKREENWVIVLGTAEVVLDGESFVLKRGESIFIPKEAKHRIMNTSTETLVFVEVQTGEYFGEDDIIRLEDEYDRV